MAKKKKESKAGRKAARNRQITLRVPEDWHATLTAIAETLGLDVNGLIRLMIARGMNQVRMEAQMLLEQATQNINLLNLWKSSNPDRPIREFWDEYWNYWSAKRMKEATEPLVRGFDFETAEEMARRMAQERGTDE